MKWIPCEERLPNNNREVLISLEWGIDIGTYERGEWRSEWINHYDDDNVLAWMPLPQPYTADRKTEPSNSEKPNNCEVKNYCDDCLYTDTCDSKAFFYACTSKATISKMEQVEDEPQTPMCETCRYDKPNNPKCDECILGEDKPSNYAPQTDCPWR